MLGVWWGSGWELWKSNSTNGTFVGKLLGLGTFWGFEGRSGVPFPSMHHQTITTPAPAKPFPQIARGEEKLLHSDVLMYQTIPQEIVSVCNAADKLSKPQLQVIL